MSKYTYEEIDKRYQRLSHENFKRCHKKDTAEGYAFALKRERRIKQAFLNDCKRYLTEKDVVLYP